MKPTPKCPRLALHVQEDTSYSAYRLRARVVTIGPTSDDPNLAHDKIRNASDRGGGYRGLHLYDLEATAYGYEPLNGATDDNPRRVSFHDPLCYDTTRPDQNAIEKMAKTLRIIAARMKKQTAKLGYPDSFGAYLARLGLAIGAEAMIFDRGRQTGASYDDNEHRVTNLGDGVGQVDHYGRAWSATGKAQKDTAAGIRESLGSIAVTQ